MNVKKKGILKGFKYFSQIFDEEESKEIQIGMPTDVKHVAHIGWDGPTATAPSWMDDFKQTNGGHQSAPLDGSGSREMDVSEDKGHKSHASNPTAMDTTGREKDMPPKASRRHQSMESVGLNESPPGSPSGTHNTSKQKDRDSKSVGGRRRKEKSSKPKEGSGDEEGASQSAPSIPKKSRRKKSKDPDGKSSSKSKQSKNGSISASEDGGSIKSSAAIDDEEE